MPETQRSESHSKTVKKQVAKLTEAAQRRIETLIANHGDIVGLRLSLKAGGCAGFSYIMEPVQAPQKGDDIIEQGGAVLFVDPLAIVYILGTTIDWQEDVMQSMFTFENPNEAASCGCGVSFSV